MNPKTKNWLGLVVVGVRCRREEVVVVGDPEGVNDLAGLPDVGSERDALDLGRNVAGRQAAERRNNVKESVLGTALTHEDK